MLGAVPRILLWNVNELPSLVNSEAVIARQANKTLRIDRQSAAKSRTTCAFLPKSLARSETRCVQEYLCENLVKNSGCGRIGQMCFEKALCKRFLCPIAAGKRALLRLMGWQRECESDWCEYPAHGHTRGGYSDRHCRPESCDLCHLHH